MHAFSNGTKRSSEAVLSQDKNFIYLDQFLYILVYRDNKIAVRRTAPYIARVQQGLQ